MLSKMRVSSKLLVLVAVPLVALAGFAFSVLPDLAKERSTMRQLAESVELSVRVGALVHEMQKERGGTALYFGSKGATFSEELKEQYSETDDRRSQLQSFLKERRMKAPQPLQALLRGLEQLEDKRASARALDGKLGDYLGYYTKLNGQGLGTIDSIASLSEDPELMRRIAALSSFSYAKERAGIERAIVSNTFARGSFAPGLRDRLMRLVAEQRAFMMRFEAWAAPAHVKAYEDAMAGSGPRAAAAMRKVALSGAATFDQDAKAWFGAQTKKINALRELELSLAGELQEQASTIASAAAASLTGWSLALAVVFGVSIVLSIALIRGITKPLKSLRTAARTIAKGDLTQPIEYRGGDEIGELAQAFREMSENAKSVADAVDRVSRGESANVVARSDRDVLSQATIRLDETLAELTEELRTLIEAACAGQLESRVDASRFPGR